MATTFTKAQLAQLAEMLGNVSTPATESKNKAKGKSKTADKPRTITNPNAKPSAKQIYLVCSKALAAIGEDFPKTMGDVQTLLNGPLA